MRTEQEMIEDIADQKVMATRGPESLREIAGKLLAVNKLLAKRFGYKRAIHELDSKSTKSSDFSHTPPEYLPSKAPRIAPRMHG
jgi:hypothetical protein